MLNGIKLVKVISILGLSGTLNFATHVQGQVQPASYSQWAVDASATSQYSDTGWSASQATGAPNTPACQDSQTAWASATKNGTDILTVTFSSPVIPTELDIYETFNPGWITTVELIPSDGSQPILIGGDASDSGSACPSVFAIPVFGVTTSVSGARIHVNQKNSPGWDEIDAVKLTGTAPPGVNKQWASKASATSQYSDPNWSAMQVSGPPNVVTCQDDPHSWASASRLSPNDTLSVFYSVPVVPTQIDIYESYEPGAITSVDLIPADGSAPIPVPSSADSATTACPGIFTVTISGISKLINGVAIHLDQSHLDPAKGKGWNEIDAVQLTGVVGDGSVTTISAATNTAPSATSAATKAP